MKTQVRAQVAFLAIIAILVIVGVVGTILIFSSPAPSSPPPRVTGSPDLSVERCAQRSFDESIALVALYGGWTDPHAYSGIDSFDMNGRDFPLWSEEAHIPTTRQLSEQIADTLTSRLDRCTQDLEGPRTVSVDVQLSRSTSRAAIEIDGWMVLDGAQQRLAPFAVESRLPIAQARDTADEFVKRAWSEEVFTDLNFELISMNPRVPLEGVDFSCTPKRWSVSEVSEAFFSSVEDSVAYVSFDGSARTEHERLRDTLTFDLGLPDEVSVSAYYFTDYGGELDVDRRSGDVMSSYVIGSPDSGVCQNTYQFWYSMDYPIVFTLTTPAQGEDLLFRFAVPISVERNQESGVSVEGDSAFCSDVTPRTFSLDVVDADSGAPLDDVIGTFICDSNRCPLTPRSGGIEDHLPARCLSATIMLDKEGYAQERIDYRYDSDLSGSTIELEPLIEARVELSCNDEPCSFPDSLIARIDGRPYPLAVGTTFLPQVPDSILVLESRPSGPHVAYRLEPRGSSVSIEIDTDRYADPGGYSITQIFGSEVNEVV